MVFMASISVEAFQSDEHPRSEEWSETIQERRDHRRAERKYLYLEDNTGPQTDTNSATEDPVDIKPGPYVPLGTIKDTKPKTSAEQSLYFDIIDNNGGKDNVLLPLEVDYFDVETGELNRIDIASSGLLGTSGGGYSLNLWQGSSLENIIKLIEILPVGSLSPAQNRVARKLLLSAARVPLGQMQPQLGFENQDRKPETETFLIRRLQKISETGRLDDLLDFFELLPPDFSDNKIRQLKVDTALLDGDAIGACAIAEEARVEDGASRWLKILTYCQALEGNHAGVSFNLSILEESGELSELFTQLIEDVVVLSEGSFDQNMLARQANITEEDNLTPLLIAMVRTTGQEPSFEVLINESVRNLAALTRRADLSSDFRAKIGKKAALRGALTPSDLASVYKGLDYTEGERGSVYLLAETVEGARVDGLIYNLSREEQDLDKKADLLRVAWGRALRDGSYPVMAGVLGTTLMEIPPSANFSYLAHDAGTIALLSQNITLANKWYEMVRGRAAQSDIEATKALINLWPLMLVSDLENKVPFGAEVIDLWLKSLEILSKEDRQKKASIFFGVIEALGYDVPENLWDNLLDIGPQDILQMPSLVIWRKMALAQSKGLLGESIILGLIALGDLGLAGADMSLLSSVISGLKRLGLEEEARAMAVEILIGHEF